MKIYWLAIILVGMTLNLRAEEPAVKYPDGCRTLHDQVLAPKLSDRALPLLTGGVIKGFRPACTLRWSALSPKNEPIAVKACVGDDLVQLENDTACGAGTGRLWVSRRWVVTQSDLAHRTNPSTGKILCQQLETASSAVTRGFCIHGAEKATQTPEPPPKD